jgi:MinD-like ATPase involved in chromosome partitioning or flagellar assembly
VQHSTGIKVMLAPPTPESTELITGAHIKHVLELLRERYAYIVVDTWPSRCISSRRNPSASSTEAFRSETSP